ncbi:uncharacterized protein LOC105198616 [Solenopsis invicta]|uniref:uncharacterized protein LOC105198616 n=1 Tax=Solenopsis invicta TaxID=13686 RepID=UPI0005962E7B|nr:uncharacterized protein LOC105198616 [Solenopsis invicta]
MKEWVEYFKGLLGGVEKRVVGRTRREKREDEGNKKELSKKEIEKAIGRAREGKAAGGDEIPGEVWKYEEERLEEAIWKICDRVWKCEEWIEDWSEGMIVPIRKKGEGKKVEDYRGVTLMPSLYKIYATIVADRVEEEIEERNKVPQNQTGFRKGMGTMANIYVLNYLVNRQLSKERGKLVAFFIDLKAAFDSVDREVLGRTMRERGISEEMEV